MEKITEATLVEDIVERYPSAVYYGVQEGISLISCSGSYPLSLGELLKRKKVDESRIKPFIEGLNRHLGLGD